MCCMNLILCLVHFLFSMTKLFSIFLKIPVVMSTADGQFPGLYCLSLLSNPWLSDGRTLILSSIWGSSQVILSANILT